LKARFVKNISFAKKKQTPHMPEINRRDEALIVGAMLCIILPLKWLMINYGLPYQTHVDEMTVLTDPFKKLLLYAQGDFSVPTNLFNWLMVVWYGIVFVIGLIGGAWSGFADFKLFLLSSSGELLLTGRLFSVVASVAGAIIITKLIFRITKNTLERILFALIFVFNPAEIIGSNLVKYEGIAYLFYAAILYLGYGYFVEREKNRRYILYLLLFLALSLRVEMIAYLAGFAIYDFFVEERTTPFIRRIGVFFKPFAYGVILYCVITLYPLALVYKVTYPNATQQLTVSPTYEEAIVTKFPSAGYLFSTMLDSSFYLQGFLAIMGPLALLFFVLSLKRRDTHFLYIPFVITFFALAIFPVKNAYYMLNSSVIILLAFAIYVSKEIRSVKWRYICTSVTLLWILSFSVPHFFTLWYYKDSRIRARDYLLKKTSPEDYIYTEGVFTSIYDKPARYILRSEASKLAGGTGLSSELIASRVTDNESRYIMTVSEWEPFDGTAFENVFNNYYDTSLLAAQRPKFYLYIPDFCTDLDFSENNPRFRQFKNFYANMKLKYEPDTVFSYPVRDNRLRFANGYFKPVVIYKRKEDL
jgi:hypothetical protein